MKILSQIINITPIYSSYFTTYIHYIPEGEMQLRGRQEQDHARLSGHAGQGVPEAHRQARIIIDSLICRRGSSRVMAYSQTTRYEAPPVPPPLLKC